MKVTELFEGTSKAASKKLEDAIVGNWLKLSASQIVKKVKGWPEFKGMTDAQIESMVDDAHYQAHNQVDEGLMTEAFAIKLKNGKWFSTEQPTLGPSRDGNAQVKTFKTQEAADDFLIFQSSGSKVGSQKFVDAVIKRYTPSKVKEGLVTEGAYVIKNAAGVEKRFKDANSEAAKLWKASGLKDTAKHEPAPKVDKKAQLQAEVSLVSQCLSTADGWGELDYFDVMMRKVFPAIVKGVRKDPSKYGEAFKGAIDAAVKRDGLWDKVQPWLEKAAKDQGYKSFSLFADDMNHPDLS